jgi:hypothetical protein
MPNWSEFAWAGFLYGSLGGDRHYQALMQTDFLPSLRSNPNNVKDTDVQQYLLKGYLNAWRTRLQNSLQSASAIKASISDMIPWLSALSGLSIKTVNFQDMLMVNGQRLTVADAVEACYRIFRATGYKIAATATGKVLHVLNPELFVMWDKPIRTCFFYENSGITDSPEGYRMFLQQMNRDAVDVCSSFASAALNPSPELGDSPDAYLSRQMNYNPPKTMAKYLDEYYWVTITNGVAVPPRWHP